MYTNDTRKDENRKSPSEKKYIPPTIEVIVLEMEEGISKGSSLVYPNPTQGPVETEWEGSDETNIDIGNKK